MPRYKASGPGLIGRLVYAMLLLVPLNDVTVGEADNKGMRVFRQDFSLENAFAFGGYLDCFHEIRTGWR